MNIAARALVVRTLAGLVVGVGIAGLLLTYFTVPRFLPEYGPALLWCGLLALGGASLLLCAGSDARWATVLRPAAAVLVVTAIGASVYSGVATRVWIQAVIATS